MLNELFAREILETSIGLGILQEMNGGRGYLPRSKQGKPRKFPRRVVYR